jgi:hypothetical protein
MTMDEMQILEAVSLSPREYMKAWRATRPHYSRDSMRRWRAMKRAESEVMDATAPLSPWFLRSLCDILNPSPRKDRPVRGLPVMALPVPPPSIKRGPGQKEYLRWWRARNPDYHRDKQRQYRARDAELRERGYL